jgi:hypothetical protein
MVVIGVVLLATSKIGPAFSLMPCGQNVNQRSCCKSKCGRAPGRVEKGAVADDHGRVAKGTIVRTWPHDVKAKNMPRNGHDTLLASITL